MIGRVSSPRFVGRSGQLAMLEAALAPSQRGSGSVVLVGGEAGMGKSRLISELAGRAQSRGMTVAVGECLPFGEAELPYAPIVGALRSLMRHGGVAGGEYVFFTASVYELGTRACVELAALAPGDAGVYEEQAH